MKSEEKLVDLIIRIKNGDEEAFNELLKNKEPLIKSMANKYFLLGAEFEDIVQVGCLGLYKATKTFDIKKNSNINIFLNMCIKREVVTAIKTYTRKKHSFLNKSIRITKSVDLKYDDEFILVDSIKDEIDIETMIIEKEINENINKLTSNMSEMQRQVFTLYLNGYKQREICKELNLDKKQVDNALTRSKGRMKEILSMESVS